MNICKRYVQIANMYITHKHQIIHWSSAAQRSVNNQEERSP